MKVFLLMKQQPSMMVAGLVRVQRYGIIVISCPDVCLEKDAISVRMW